MSQQKFLIPRHRQTDFIIVYKERLLIYNSNLTIHEYIYLRFKLRYPRGASYEFHKKSQVKNL